MFKKKPKADITIGNKEDIEIMLSVTIPKDVFSAKKILDKTLPQEMEETVGAKPATIPKKTPIPTPTAPTPKKWYCSQCHNPLELYGIEEPVVCNYCGATSGFRQVGT